MSPLPERLKADLTLLTVAVIWGSAFVAQRVAALQAGVYLFNGLRFLLGALVLLPFALRQGRGPAPGAASNATSSRPGYAFSRERRSAWGGVGLLGALLFGGAAFQQMGLRYTTAGNAGFITGLYVVLIPLILALGWRQPPRRASWGASFLAAGGLFLLSTRGRVSLNPGDILELAGAFLWAFHVITLDRLVRRLDVLRLAIGQYLVCAAINLGVGLFVEVEPALLSGLAAAWLAIAYTGVLSVGLGYTLQAVGQRTAPPADAAIILSMEAVFAALFGWLLLDEALNLPQLLGCALMLAAMLWAQTSAARV
jgi:drug/metabolite transporter (DMT)-like permease